MVSGHFEIHDETVWAILTVDNTIDPHRPWRMEVAGNFAGEGLIDWEIWTGDRRTLLQRGSHPIETLGSGGLPIVPEFPAQPGATYAVKLGYPGPQGGTFVLPPSAPTLLQDDQTTTLIAGTQPPQDWVAYKIAVLRELLAALEEEGSDKIVMLDVDDELNTLQFFTVHFSLGRPALDRVKAVWNS